MPIPICRRIRARKIHAPMPNTDPRFSLQSQRENRHLEIHHHDLHPTKGWKKAGHRRIVMSNRDWMRAPEFQEHFIPDPNRSRDISGMRHLDYPPRQPDIKKLQRHSWFRRKMRHFAAIGAGSVKVSFNASGEFVFIKEYGRGNDPHRL